MENVVILGAGGFIGTNLSIYFAKNKRVNLTLIDRNVDRLKEIQKRLNYEQNKRTSVLEYMFEGKMSFNEIIENQDVVYHLVSTTNPTTSNKNISKEFFENVIMTNNLLEACVRHGVKRVIFLSSGGTVYGISQKIPLKEDMPTFPINSYGMQKVTIEKLLYFYKYMYDLDYRVIRLSNPYGPYQRPNGIQGVVTTFIYKALKKEKIVVYGDGSIIRDFIYIDDAINGIINIAESNVQICNLGTGRGYNIKELIRIIRDTLNVEVSVCYLKERKVDVPVNVLDIDRYKSIVKECKFIELKDGIIKTAEFLKEFYKI